MLAELRNHAVGVQGSISSGTGIVPKGGQLRTEPAGSFEAPGAPRAVTGHLPHAWQDGRKRGFVINLPPRPPPHEIRYCLGSLGSLASGAQSGAQDLVAS